MTFWRPASVRDNKFAYRFFSEPYTVVELKYMHVLCEVLAKPSWWTKMKDTAILAKWKTESTLSENDFAFLVGELKWITMQSHLDDPLQRDHIIPLPVHGVFTTDILVGSDLLQAIQTHTAPAEAAARQRG
ncbi:hypothetical protein As57867_011715, partial [Aphanomyces stellatus]